MTLGSSPCSLTQLEFTHSLGKVDEAALGQLGLILNLAEQLVDDSDPPCWNLTWIVRDFTLELIHPETKEMMTPTEYLTMALTIQGGLDAAKNKTRSTIQRLFDRRECITCPVQPKTSCSANWLTSTTRI